MISIKKKFTITGVNCEDTVIVDSEALAIEYISQQPMGSKYMIIPSYETMDSEKIDFRVSICMPIWKAPKRTIRAIESVLAQDTHGWQLICLGDGDDEFGRLLTTQYWEDLKTRAVINGNEVIGINMDHWGGFGFTQRNKAKKLARGKYMLYLDNDDVLLPNHVSVRLESVEKSEDECDFAYFDTWLNPMKWHRDAQLKFGSIGHSELLFRTEFLRTLPDSPSEYGHDWTLVEQAMAKTSRYRKIISEPTYRVMSTPAQPEQGID